MPLLPLYPTPPDAAVLCADPAARNHAADLDPTRRELRRRFTGILRRRWQRVVRETLGIATTCSVPLHGRWRTPTPRPGRALCAESGRCRMHLAEFFYEGDAPLWEACALVVAERGGLSQDAVGSLTGMSRQAVQQIERRAYSLRRMRALREPPREQAALEARVEGALERRGERSLLELATLVRAADDRVLAVLHGMRERGEVTDRKTGHAQARVWTLTRGAANAVDTPVPPL